MSSDKNTELEELVLDVLTDARDNHKGVSLSREDILDFIDQASTTEEVDAAIDALSAKGRIVRFVRGFRLASGLTLAFLGMVSTACGGNVSIDPASVAMPAQTQVSDGGVAEQDAGFDATKPLVLSAKCTGVTTPNVPSTYARFDLSPYGIQPRDIPRIDAVRCTDDRATGESACEPVSWFWEATKTSTDFYATHSTVRVECVNPNNDPQTVYIRVEVSQ